MSHPADITSLSIVKQKAPFEVDDAFIRANSSRIPAYHWLMCHYNKYRTLPPVKGHSVNPCRLMTSDITTLRLKDKVVNISLYKAFTTIWLCFALTLPLTRTYGFTQSISLSFHSWYFARSASSFTRSQSTYPIS